jgi:succinyl-diaminopimelate desuccinylase
MKHPVLEIASKLIKIPSVTPCDKGCMQIAKDLLAPIGFSIEDHNHKEVSNLLATHGSGSPFLLFLGHTDVVPEGDRRDWEHDPFLGEIILHENTEYLYGRGSSDMKGGDAAMLYALKTFVQKHPLHQGTVGIALTSNEEGDAVGATPYLVEVLKNSQRIPDFCLIGECSCDKVFGDSIKNGRRGDFNATIEVLGQQGHVALEQEAKNAIFEASRFISAMQENPLDHGTKDFPKSSFQVSNIHAGTGADNVIPGRCTLRCNVRFNDLQSEKSILEHLKAVACRHEIKVIIEGHEEGLPFITKEGILIEVLSQCIEEVLSIKPALGATGGTSDGRFIRPLGTQTIEFGPVSKRIHKVNEMVKAEDLINLYRIYEKCLEKLFL